MKCGPFTVFYPTYIKLSYTIMEKILTTYNIDETKYLKIQHDNTSFVKSYFNRTMDRDVRHLFQYLDGLDPNCESYMQFGADKCSVDKFLTFCEEVNIDANENMLRIIQELSTIDPSETAFYRYHFYSRDKKLTCTCKNIGDYLHYFGITGESNEIVKAFDIFQKRCNFDESGWGGRDFI